MPHHLSPAATIHARVGTDALRDLPVAWLGGVP